MAAALKKVILIILGTMGDEPTYLDLGNAPAGDKIAAGKIVDTKIANLANEGPRTTCVQGTGKLAYLEGDDGTHKYICDAPPHTGGNKRRKKSKKTKKKKQTKKRKTMKKKK
jgi:hypothetical protein